jgi:hypothetical protein
MKAFTAILAVAALAMGAVAQTTPSETATETPSAPAVPVVQPPSKNEIEKCIEERNCAPDDISCRAKCAGVPNPSEEQVNRTNACAAGCDKSDTEAYAACVDKCIKDIFIPIPDAPGAAPTSGSDGEDGDADSEDSSEDSGATIVSYSAGLAGVALLAAAMNL